MLLRTGIQTPRFSSPDERVHIVRALEVIEDSGWLVGPVLPRSNVLALVMNAVFEVLRKSPILSGLVRYDDRQIDRDVIPTIVVAEDRAGGSNTLHVNARSS